jgi:hypothetical protein
MSIPEPTSQRNPRVRRSTQHRGWAARQRTPEALAKDIATSILSDLARDCRVREATEFTTCPITLGLVAQLLAHA